MLSIDAARSSGYRDSLYFFRRNPLIHKLTCTQTEKDKLIELGKLSSNLKSRAVTMVSARNCFKVMGAAFVAGGRYVFDDYYEDKALAAGHKPGEPVYIEPYDPDKDSGTLASAKGPAPLGATGTGVHQGRDLAKPKLSTGAPREDYISSQIGGGINATFGGTGLQPFGKTWDPAAKKAKPAAHLSVENWMFEYAKSVAESNRELGVTRKMNVGQVQVGLGVVEREEDMWIEVEEDDEDEDEVSAPPLQPPPPAPAMEVNSPAGGITSTSQVPESPFDGQGLATAPPSVAAGSRSGSAAPLPKKRKLIKVYNPIRGVYEPETNVPHVYKTTQPTRSSIEHADRAPSIFATQGDKDVDDEQVRKWRKLELAAARRGVATVEYFADPEASYGFGGEPLLPGIWNFGAGAAAVEACE